jgi:hypothetical protein
LMDAGDSHYMAASPPKDFVGSAISSS